MHFVSRIDDARMETPKAYSRHSVGFARVGYVDRGIGSVHMGVGICRLAPAGFIAPHLHSFEESFYILEGRVNLEIGEATHELGPGNFGLIHTGLAHSWSNPGKEPARWLEMQAPQPRPLEHRAGRDTFFVDREFPAEAGEAKLGHFDEALHDPVLLQQSR